MAQELEMTILPMKDIAPNTSVPINSRATPGTEIPGHASSQSIVESIPPSNEKHRSRWRIIAILVALFVRPNIAQSSLMPALTAPTISRELNSAAGYTWIGAAYLLANAASGVIWAKLSDIWGRKLIVLLALATFLASSAVCATAKTMTALIVGRAVQGAAGGGLILLVHVCISDLFSLRQRSLLMGLTEGIWALAGGVGPVLGGVFASLVSWRWCYIKHEDTTFLEGLKAVDWLGVFTFLAFTLMVLLGLDFGGAIFPWDSSKIIALLVVGGIMIFAFIYSESRVAKYPLVPMHLFKKRTNVAAIVVVFFHGFVFISAEYYMPLFLQSVLEASPLRSGLLLLPFIFVGACAGILGGIWIHRTGNFRELIWLGSFLLCLGWGLFISFDAYSTTAKAAGFQIIAGIGSGLLFEPPLIALQSQVDQEDVATATSTLSFIRNMGLTISVVIGGTIFMNSMDNEAPSLRQAGLTTELLRDFSGENAMANVMLGATLENPEWELAVKKAFSVATRNMWITYTIFAFLCFIAGFFVEASHLGTQHTETVTGLKKETQEQKNDSSRVLV